MFKDFFVNMFDFSGTASRREYWRTLLITIPVYFISFMLCGILFAIGVAASGNSETLASDAIALKNAESVQRDFESQLALAAVDSTVTPDASGTWLINGATYSYTASEDKVPAIGTTIERSPESEKGGNKILGMILMILGGLLLFVCVVAFTVGFISILVRRLHDVDKSGWLVLLTYIPVVGVFVGIYVFILTLQE